MLQERGARGEMARTNEQLRRAAEAERRTWMALDRPAPLTSVSSQQVAARYAVLTAGTLAAATQHDVTQRAEDGVAVARDHWTIAARRVEALERWDERTRAAEALEDERRRNLEIDDMVLARRGRHDGSASKP
jgi:flagellar biosynthesis chaperone FliJ